MDRPLRVALIGCGWAGSRHAAAFTRCGAELSWAVDTDAARARSIPARSRAPDYRRALDDPGIDAVSICLPHDLHAPVAIAAAAAGKHVLVEKSLSGTPLSQPQRRNTR